MTNTVLARLAIQISANNAEFQKKLHESQRSFQTFTRTVSTAASTLGIAFGATTVFSGLQYGISTIADFEHRISEVKAITQATGPELKQLRDNALELGRSTKFTAEQVGGLQVAYGRLGFTTKEILNATKATLDLAAATGEDLAKSADVAGSTLRGFELDASQMQRVVDVMAESFNKTALGLDNFAESMKYVAPVANAAGASIEETTAMLGVLADSGIRGSMAGTSLRKIFTDISKDGRPLRERLAELAEKGITMADAFDEVGRTAQTSLIILANNTGKIDTLTEALNNSAGAGSKMAAVMQDDLTGDFTIFRSAVDGLILSFSKTSGPMREFIQDLTKIVNLINSGEGKYVAEWMKMVFFVPRMTVKGVGKTGEMFKDWAKIWFGGDERGASSTWDPVSWVNPNKVKQAKQLESTLTGILSKIGFTRPDKETFQSDDTNDMGFDINDPFGINNMKLEMPVDPEDVVDGIVAETEANYGLAESLANLTEERQKQIDAIQRQSEALVHIGETIGSAFTAAATGQQTFVDALKQVTGEIIQLYLRQAIAAMIAKAIQTGKTPVGALIAAGIGIGAVRALFSSNLGSGSSSGGSSGPPGQSPSEYYKRQEVQVEVVGKISGDSIGISQEKNGYRRGRLG